MNNERTLPEGTNKRHFCKRAGISPPTLYKWLRGGNVHDFIENAIRLELARMERRAKAHAA